MAEPELDLSVVVISWNQRMLLETLVEQLLNQSIDPDRYEIIIVDDGSTDGTRDWLRGLSGSRIKVILGETDIGRAASRNRGIRAASGKIVVMLDGDHSVQSDILSIHAKRHQHEVCAVVGKSVFADMPDCRAINHYLNNGGAAKLPENSRLPGRYFLTRNCSAPKDVLMQVGLFDEAFCSWGGEDLDLGVRLEDSGIPIYGEPRALAVHHHHRDFVALLSNIYRYGYEGIPLLVAKHPRLHSELGLNYAMALPDGCVRPNAARRLLVRALMMAPIYRTLLWTSNALRRHRVPRIIFDYLHWRQYVKGYMYYLKYTRTMNGRTH